MSATGRLAEKRAVVTGAGRGIGQAIALRLAQEGAHVAAVDIDRESAEATADRIRDDGGIAAALTADLGRVDRIEPMIDEAVSALGRLDILVNNAGRVEIKPFLDLTEMEWDQVIDLNLKGTYFCMQAGARQMIRQGGGGRIINMSSISGRHGRADSSAYAASKMAVISITQSAALALADHGILVNALCPGVVAHTHVGPHRRGPRPPVRLRAGNGPRAVSGENPPQTGLRARGDRRRGGLRRLRREHADHRPGDQCRRRHGNELKPGTALAGLRPPVDACGTAPAGRQRSGRSGLILTVRNARRILGRFLFTASSGTSHRPAWPAQSA